MGENKYLYKITPQVDVSDNMSVQTKEIMGKHFLYLKDLHTKGKLLLAGPCLDREFGIAIFEAENLEQAEIIMNNDPCISEGVMKGELHPFRASLMRGVEA